MELTPIEGIAMLYCYDSDGEPILIHGTYNEPSSLTAIGMFTVGLGDAKKQFSDSDTYEE
jgi:hypothetical protein